MSEQWSCRSRALDRVAASVLLVVLVAHLTACTPGATSSGGANYAGDAVSIREVWLLLTPLNVGAIDVEVNGRRVPWRKVSPGGPDVPPGMYNVGLDLPVGIHEVAVTTSGSAGRTVVESVNVRADRRVNLKAISLAPSARVYLELPPAQARRVADGRVEVRIQANGLETWFFTPGSGSQNPNSIFTTLGLGDHVLDVTFVGYGSVRVVLRDLRLGEVRTVRVIAPF